MTAHGDDAACTGAGVRKPSVKETAMGERVQCRGLELCRPRTPTQLQGDGTNVAKWGFEVSRRL